MRIRACSRKVGTEAGDEKLKHDFFSKKNEKKNSSTALAAGANGRGARVPGFLDRPGRLRTSRARDGRSARLYIRLMRRW